MTTFSTTIKLPTRPLSPEEQKLRLDSLMVASADGSAPAEQLIHDAKAVRVGIQSDPTLKSEIRTALDDLSADDLATLFFS